MLTRPPVGAVRPVAILSHRLRAQGPRLAAAQARLGFIRECFVWRHHRWDQITRDDFQVITTGIGNIKRAQLHPVALEWLYDRKLVCRRIGVGGDWHPTDSKEFRQGPFDWHQIVSALLPHIARRNLWKGGQYAEGLDRRRGN